MRQSLMVATEATPAHNPGEGPLDHPSSGQRLKSRRKQAIPLDLGAFGHKQAALGNFETPHDLHAPAQMEFEPGDQSASVVAVPPQQLDGGKDRTHSLKHALGALLIGVVRTGDLDGQQMALRVHEQVPFPAPNFFPGVVAFLWATNRAGFDGLTVDDGHRRLRMSALLGPNLQASVLSIIYCFGSTTNFFWLGGSCLCGVRCFKTSLLTHLESTPSVPGALMQRLITRVNQKCEPYHHPAYKYRTLTLQLPHSNGRYGHKRVTKDVPLSAS